MIKSWDEIKKEALRAYKKQETEAAKQVVLSPLNPEEHSIETIQVAASEKFKNVLGATVKPKEWRLGDTYTGLALIVEGVDIPLYYRPKYDTLEFIYDDWMYGNRIHYKIDSIEAFGEFLERTPYKRTDASKENTRRTR